MHFAIDEKVQMVYCCSGDNMTLKELRISNNLTQKEAANYIGISLRSYKQYENDVSKIDTIKYKYIYEMISRLGYVDEEHGILKIQDIIKIVKEVFDIYPVEYCYLFGSYATNEARETSDVDLLVSTEITGMDFYGLAETLREKLHKKVDLLNTEQLTNNLKLLDEVLKNGIKIFG